MLCSPVTFIRPGEKFYGNTALKTEKDCLLNQFHLQILIGKTQTLVKSYYRIVCLHMKGNCSIRFFYCQIHHFPSNSASSYGSIHRNVNQNIFGNVAGHSGLVHNQGSPDFGFLQGQNQKSTWSILAKNLGTAFHDIFLWIPKFP